jgi:LmbE family N-acetylglucosaminyl deacetylase
VNFGVPDQETAFALAEVTSWIERLLRSLEPDLVLTHPYEGGHPDHDACAYAVQRAVRNRSQARCEAHVIEFACYHATPGGIQTLEFLEGGGFVMELTSAERAAKQRAFGSFETQKQTLSLFQCATERFRSSPGYDFTKPPHPGELYYERFDWGMTGDRFRDLVRRQESL